MIMAEYASVSLNMSKYPWKCLNKLFWQWQGSEYAWSSYMFNRFLKMPCVLNKPEIWIWHGCIRAKQSFKYSFIHPFIHSFIYLMSVRKIICRKLQLYFQIKTVKLSNLKFFIFRNIQIFVLLATKVLKWSLSLFRKELFVDNITEFLPNTKYTDT